MMKGNQQIFSRRKETRVKGYKKLFKNQKEYYDPPKKIAKELVIAMEALGYDVDEKQAAAYLKSSYAVFDREYYLRHVK